MEILTVVVLVAAVVLVIDFLLAGGAVTMTCASAAAGLLSHPIGWLSLAIVAIALWGIVGWR